MIRTRRTAAYLVAAALPVAAVLGAGPVDAATEQPGVTEPAPQPGLAPTPEEQAGVSSPAPTPPSRPTTQSLAGDLVPDPPTYAPSDYRNPSPDDGTGSRTLGQDLVGLHAPAPVQPPKVIVPPPPDYLGVGTVKILRPPQVPIDLAWKINGYMAGAQRTTDTFFNSIGFSNSRSDRMATAGVLCAAGGFGAGALLTGVPAAVAGALVGSTIGGIVGAGFGTFVPVPIVGTITSGVAGTVIGGVAGAVVAGIPAAIVGGTITALATGSIGVLTTAGDGSAITRPPTPAAPPTPAPAHPSRPAPPPGPDMHAQIQQVADAGVHTVENAVHWVQAQPGGERTLNTVANTGAAVGAALEAAPGVAQVGAAVGAAAHDVVAAGKAATATSAVVNTVADVVLHHPAFTPQEFGPLTEAANAALVAAQAVVR